MGGGEGRSAHLPPDASSGQFCTEVDLLADETKGCGALRLDEDPAAREQDDSRLTGLGIDREPPVARAHRGKAPVWIVGDVSRPGGANRDALPSGRVRKGRPGLGEPLESANGSVFIYPLDDEHEARNVDLDREAARLIGEFVIDRHPLVGRRGGLGARRRRHQGREGHKDHDSQTFHDAVPFGKAMQFRTTTAHPAGGPLARSRGPTSSPQTDSAWDEETSSPTAGFIATNHSPTSPARGGGWSPWWRRRPTPRHFRRRRCWGCPRPRSARGPGS